MSNSLVPILYTTLGFCSFPFVLFVGFKSFTFVSHTYNKRYNVLKRRVICADDLKWRLSVPMMINIEEHVDDPIKRKLLKDALGKLLHDISISLKEDE